MQSGCERLAPRDPVEAGRLWGAGMVLTSAAGVLHVCMHTVEAYMLLPGQVKSPRVPPAAFAAEANNSLLTEWRKSGSSMCSRKGTIPFARACKGEVQERLMTSWALTGCGLCKHRLRRAKAWEPPLHRGTPPRLGGWRQV